MPGKGSYDLSSFALDSDTELRRLNAQIDLFWKQELALYLRLGLKEGMRLLDCGCGTGYVLQKLRDLFPGLQCTGIDYDARLAAAAKENLAKPGLKPCNIFQQSATSLDLPDNSFDFVICRLVLEHLPDPMPAVKEVQRALAAGGKAVFIDNDFDLHEQTWPESAALGELYDAYRRARRAEGGNPCIGRQLPRVLRQAGFAAVDLQVLVAHNELVGDQAFLKAEGSGIPAQLVKTGYLDPASLQRITTQWRSMLASADHAIFRMLLAATGEKPAGEPVLSPVSEPRAASSSGDLVAPNEPSQFSTPPAFGGTTGIHAPYLGRRTRSGAGIHTHWGTSDPCGGGLDGGNDTLRTAGEQSRGETKHRRCALRQLHRRLVAENHRASGDGRPGAEPHRKAASGSGGSGHLVSDTVDGVPPA